MPFVVFFFKFVWIFEHWKYIGTVTLYDRITMTNVSSYIDIKLYKFLAMNKREFKFYLCLWWDRKIFRRWKNASVEAEQAHVLNCVRHKSCHNFTRRMLLMHSQWFKQFFKPLDISITMIHVSPKNHVRTVQSCLIELFFFRFVKFRRSEKTCHLKFAYYRESMKKTFTNCSNLTE